MTGDPKPSELVIDAHTHVFPPEVRAGRSAYLARDAWFCRLYERPRSVLATAEDLIASMDEAGVARSVICGFPWTDPGICREHNAYLAESAKRSPDRLSWLGIVVPGSPPAMPDARWCFEHGACGLGEFNADAQGFDLRDASAFAGIASLCVDAARPVMLHTSEPVGHDYPGKGTATPEKVLAFLAKFPALDVIAAHWGGGLPFYELMPEVAALTRRVVYDSGASTYLYRFDVFRTVLGIVGPGRVLFGSDYPVLRQGKFLERSRATSWISERERDAVFGGNASRVFKLPGSEGV